VQGLLRLFQFLGTLTDTWFYVLYGIYTVTVLAGLWVAWAWLRHTVGEKRLAQASAGLIKPTYLQAASLTGGLPQLIDVALCELLRQGRLRLTERILSDTDGCEAAETGDAHPVEHGLLECCQQPLAATDLARRAAKAVSAAFESDLRELHGMGLLPTPCDWLASVLMMAAGLVAVVWPGAVRLIVSAAAGGYECVTWLVVLAAAPLIVSFVFYPRLSPLGNAVMAQLRRDYLPVLRKAGKHALTPEVIYAAALFGPEQVPGVCRRLARALEPPSCPGDYGWD
jgi:uncharacterized protein (TIGR04222 family)